MRSSVVSPGDIAVASMLNNLRGDIVDQGGDYAATTGSANAYVLALDSEFSLAAGVIIKFKANFTNTGSATLNVNSSGAKSLIGVDGAALTNNAILNGGIYIAIYDGTNWQVLNSTPANAAKYLWYGTPFGDLVGFQDTTSQLFLSNDKLSCIAMNAANIYTYTRASLNNPFNSLSVSSNAHGMDSGAKFAHYVESGTDYIIGKTSASNSLRRCAFNGSGGALVTISGSAPSTYGGLIAWDAVNNYLLVRDGTTTQIRRYTISGTTITNINSDITLSANPSGASLMKVVNNEIWIWEAAAGTTKIKRYDMTGTLLDTTTVCGGVSTYSLMLFLTEYNGDVYYYSLTSSGFIYENKAFKVILPN